MTNFVVAFVIIAVTVILVAAIGVVEIYACDRYILRSVRKDIEDAEKDGKSTRWLKTVKVSAYLMMVAFILISVVQVLCLVVRIVF